jgi:hypothetical protein
MPDVTLSKEQIEEIAKAVKKSEPSGLEKFAVQSLKIDPVSVKFLGTAFSTVSSIVSLAGSLIGAWGTVQTMLAKLDLIKADDPNADLKASMQTLHDQDVHYYEGTDAADKLKKRVDWQSKVDSAASAASNLGTARSDGNFDDGRRALGDLYLAILEMTETVTVPGLDADIPAFGNVPFVDKTFGFEIQDVFHNTPSHWIAYAYPPWMHTAGGRRVEYSSRTDVLSQRIFDPSYYLDVLIHGVSEYITLLATLEPAYRGTGYCRAELRKLSLVLDGFTSAWRRSIMLTDVEVFFSSSPPGPDFAVLNHPWLGHGIPLGVIDPVSGLAIFDSEYREGFYFSEWGGELAPGAVVGHGFSNLIANATEAIRLAATEIDKRHQAVEYLCGLSNLDDLITKLDALCTYGIGLDPPVSDDDRARLAAGGNDPKTPVSGSLYARIESLGRTVSPFEERPEEGRGPPLIPVLVEHYINIKGEEVDAGYVGRKYLVHRRSQSSDWTVRMTIPRRQDATRTQLGYRIEVAIVGANGAAATLHIAKLDTAISPYEDDAFPLFPASPAAAAELHADDADLYSIIQSAEFSDVEEFQLGQNKIPPGKIRLLANKKKGGAAIKITAVASFDKTDRFFPYLAQIDLRIENLTSESDRAFFVVVRLIEIADQVYSSWMPATGNTDSRFAVVENKAADIPCGQIKLCLDPTYLIAGPEYFADRARAAAESLDVRLTLPIGVHEVPTGFDGHEAWRLDPERLKHTRMRTFR